MIAGQVTPEGQAVVFVSVIGSDPQGQEIEAIVDTGFDGDLALPVALITLLELPLLDYAEYLQGDGEPQIFAIHEAVILWDGAPKTVPALASNSSIALIGMALLRGYNLSMDVVDGGPVVLTRLIVS